MVRIIRTAMMAAAIYTWVTLVGVALGPKRLLADGASCQSNDGFCTCTVHNSGCACSGDANSCTAGCMSGGSSLCKHDPE